MRLWRPEGRHPSGGLEACTPWDPGDTLEVVEAPGNPGAAFGRRGPEAPQNPWRPLEARLRRASTNTTGSRRVIKLVFHFQFKYINGLKAVKIPVDATKRRVVGAPFSISINQWREGC